MDFLVFIGKSQEIEGEAEKGLLLAGCLAILGNILCVLMSFLVHKFVRRFREAKSLSLNRRVRLL